MNPLSPSSPRSLVDRLSWTVQDGWTLTRRSLTHLAGQPGRMAIGLLFPVMTVLMFVYLFGGAMAVPDGGSYREYLLPGMFALTMVFGLEATFVAIATDMTRGVTDRFRTLPMSASAPVVGRASTDLITSTLELAVLVLCGLLIGWRWHNGVGPALAAVGLLMLLRFALTWVGIYLALISKGPESVMAIQILVWPLGFLSNAFVSTDAMPGWLGAIASWNPLSATVAATRDLFGNPAWNSGSWAGDHALALAIAWPVVLIAVFLPLTVHRYHTDRT